MEGLRIGVLGLGLHASLTKAAHRPGKGPVAAALCGTGPEAVEQHGADCASPTGRPPGGATSTTALTPRTSAS
ncbi:hypothetical protein [Streptosporangium minutum]|uniref:hypothetical protein n=1 Tax=Streptosporangium minutum TaxID=569862 RepID=UPI001054302D|nr:hypothetical protein [Streptosporangium minutum]